MELIQIKNIIEKMNKNHQIEILKIINNNNIEFNENQNGVFINLTNLNTKILKEIQKYIVFVNKQNIFLNKQEELKENYINSYFKNNINDDTPQQTKNESNEQTKLSEQSVPSYAV